MGRWYRDSMVALKANDWMAVVESLRDRAFELGDDSLRELADTVERQASFPGPPPKKETKGVRPA